MSAMRTSLSRLPSDRNEDEIRARVRQRGAEALQMGILIIDTKDPTLPRWVAETALQLGRQVYEGGQR